MKRKLLAIMLAATMALSLSACNGKTKDENAEGRTREKNRVQEESVVEEPVKEVSAVEEPVVEECDEYQITSLLTPYNDGCAWVNYNDGSVEHTALIDTEGKSLFVSDQMVRVSNVYNEGGSIYIEVNNEYILLDGNGKETARLTDTDENDYYILAAYNGNYIVGEKIENFSESKSVVYLVDQSGKQLTEEIEVTDLPNGGKMRSFSEGIYFEEFWLGHMENGGTEDNTHAYVVFNLFDETCYAAEARKEGSYYEVDLYTCKDFDYDYCNADGYVEADINWRQLISPDDYSSKENLENCLLRLQEERDSSDYRYHSGNGVVREGLFAEWDDYNEYNKYFIYDTDDNLVCEGEFPEGAEILEVYPYSDGCAIVDLIGNDGDEYITAIDTKGNQLYEPKKAEVLYQDIPRPDQSKGYIMTYDGVLTPSGEMIPWDGDFSSVPDDVRLVVKRGCLVHAGVFEGFVVEPSTTCFRSLDGSKVIDKVKVAK